MGKTIILASLIHTNCGPDETLVPSIQSKQKKSSKSRQIRLDAAFKKQPTTTATPRTSTATLVVAPTSLINQWGEELQRCSAVDSLEVHVWHGQNRLDLDAAVDRDDIIQVVVTSYGVLASEHAKYEKSAKKNSSSIFESEFFCSRQNRTGHHITSYIPTVNWLRVILDEAHHIKSRSSKTAKAVYALSARRRWAVTGYVRQQHHHQQQGHERHLNPGHLLSIALKTCIRYCELPLSIHSCTA
jgi:DNA repair protein RAD5